MRALDKKLLRDLAAIKSQAIAIALVIACGVATLVMSLSTISSLRLTQEKYYSRYRFAHAFAHLKRAPNSLSRRLAEIPGVASLQTRIVVDVTLDIEGLREPAVGRLISVPERSRAPLNALYLRSGRLLEPGRPGEVVASEPFALAHGFQPGDQIKAIINGRLERLHIVGVALSPEYIYSIRPGDLWPDNRRFGVLWMSEAELAPAYDLKDAFNDVCLTVMRDASMAEILKQLDRLTEPYGGQGAYSRADQISHRFVSDEMAQLRAMASVAPVIFLAVAAFLLNVVVSRIIRTQREQIAALKAFGYSSSEVGWHYLKMTMLIAALGAVVGVAAGARLGLNLTEMYERFFRFPVMEFHLNGKAVIFALALGIGAALLGVSNALLHAMRLPPAEAMRPETPSGYRRLFVERFGLQRFFNQITRMILRRLQRRPWRAAFTCFGLALAISVLVLGTFSKDLVDYLNEIQFYVAQRQDLNVALIEPASTRALHELGHLAGVLRAEPYRSVPARLRAGHHSRQVALMGIEPGSELFRLIDLKRRAIGLPPAGLVISAKLAERLNVRPGHAVEIEVMEGARPVRPAVVRDIMEDISTGVAYTELPYLNRIMGEGRTLSGVFLSVDATQTDALYRKLKETPRVASVSAQRIAMESFRKIMSENLLRMRAFNIAFACIIAFGVVYNSARITLSEQSRDLATLRVIGFTRGEISAILLGEIGVLTVAAIPLGLALGYAFGAIAMKALETETQRFPLVISNATYSFAVAVVLFATAASLIVVRRRLDRLDLIAVLKARE